MRYPRWPGWMPAAVEALPHSRMSAEHCCEGRVRWMLPRVRGKVYRKRARRGNRDRAESLAARRPYRALSILKDQKERMLLTLGQTRTASRAGVVHCTGSRSKSANRTGVRLSWLLREAGDRGQQLLAAVLLVVLPSAPSG